jgi:hypothetical protein
MAKRRLLLMAGVLTIAAVLLAVAACDGGGGNGGNGDGQIGEIRTERGLSVAAVAASGAGQGEEATGGAGDSVAPGAPAADTGVGYDGMIAPDVFPYPYPSLQASQDGITVQGFASASADADSAILEFYFDSSGVRSVPGDEPDASGSGSSGSSGVAEGPLAQAITEADLQPVVDAIVAAGVAADDVEVLVQPSYGDPSYGGSATVRATVRNVSAVEGVANAGREAAGGLAGLNFYGSNVSYTVADCAALERAAMEEAVADARDRGQVFAQTLGVGLGPVVGASNYSYAPYGGTPCGGGYGGVIPLGGVAYAEGQSTAVELFATVAVTFGIQ